jgi:glucan 1,3-beta-glucosidase
LINKYAAWLPSLAKLWVPSKLYCAVFAVAFVVLYKMRFTSIITLVLPLALGEKLVIPAVEKAVRLQLAEFSDYYVDANNNTLDLDSLGPRSTNDARGIEERQAAGSYWYETIAHKGISAFNANPTTYKVYRNVKDYGAKGYEGKTLAFKKLR